MSLLGPVYKRALASRLGDLQRGALQVSFPDGSTDAFGDPAAERAELRVLDWRFFRRLAIGDDLGFAESFIHGEWTTPDLTALLEVLARNREVAASSAGWSARPRQLLERVIHWSRRNTRSGSRRNIAAHYDLGNEFFETFLDPTMTYSCGIFGSEQESLEVAQRRKIREVIEKAEVQPGDEVLEIGSGWGELAVSLAREHGCRVTTLTQSARQRDYVQARLEREQLADRVDVQLRDYRAADGLYDRIVSVEMLEAVGHENLRSYFDVCARLLRPRVALSSR